MLTIHGRKTSSNVMKVVWCAEELGLEYERHDVGGDFGGNDTAEYLAMNPMGLVPTVIDDGVTLWESHTILRYLATRYGVGKICSADPGERALCEIWMDWLSCHLNAPSRDVFWNLVRHGPDERDLAAVKNAIVAGNKIWRILDKHLQGHDYVGGNQLTIGDIPLGIAAFRWYTLVDDRPAMPGLDAWYARLCDRPAYRKHCMNPLV